MLENLLFDFFFSLHEIHCLYIATEVALTPSSCNIASTVCIFHSAPDCISVQLCSPANVMFECFVSHLDFNWASSSATLSDWERLCWPDPMSCPPSQEHLIAVQMVWQWFLV